MERNGNIRIDAGCTQGANCTQWGWWYSLTHNRGASMLRVSGDGNVMIVGNMQRSSGGTEGAGGGQEECILWDAQRFNLPAEYGGGVFYLQVSSPPAPLF